MVFNGLEVLEIFEQEMIYFIIMDIMMLQFDGIKMIFKICESKNIFIIMFFVKLEDSDKILGFNVGVDDYIMKLFNFLELVVRV